VYRKQASIDKLGAQLGQLEEVVKIAEQQKAGLCEQQEARRAELQALEEEIRGVAAEVAAEAGLRVVAPEPEDSGSEMSGFAGGSEDGDFGTAGEGSDAEVPGRRWHARRGSLREPEPQVPELCRMLLSKVKVVCPQAAELHKAVGGWLQRAGQGKVMSEVEHLSEEQLWIALHARIEQLVVSGDERAAGRLQGLQGLVAKIQSDASSGGAGGGATASSAIVLVDAFETDATGQVKRKAESPLEDAK
jgi:hypothetical protein